MNTNFNLHIKKRNTIKSAMLLYFGLFVSVLMIALIVFSYQYFKNEFISEAQKTKYKLINEVIVNLDFYFNELQDTLKTTAVNQDVLDALSNEEVNSYKKRLYFDRIVQSFLNNINIFKPDLDNIIILNREGTVYEVSQKSVRWNYNFYQKPWFSKYNEKEAKVQFIGPRTKDYYYDEVNDRAIYAAYPVINIFDKDIFVGTVIAELNMNKVSLIMNRLQSSKEEKLLLLDSSNKTIFSSDYKGKSILNKIILDRINEEKSGYFTMKIDGKESIVLFDYSKINNWKVIMIIPLDELMKNTDKFRSLLIIVLIISIPILVIITYVISNKIIRPIYALMNHMSLVEEGNFEAQISNDSYEEIKILNLRFNKMVNRINKLVNEVYKIEIEQKESQLRALQARINPHFLYNSLQTIKSMALLGKNKEIGKLVTSLGFLFRYAIGNYDYMVTIQEEIDHVKHYLNIQVKWLYKKCDIEYNISEEIMDYSMPRLTLQPIVENIFKHGFRQDDVDYKIKISGHKVENIVEMEIWDNGEGISNKRLNEIMAGLKTLNDSESTSIGLCNVNRRIVLKYGENYGISLDSNEGEWTKIKLTFPIVER